MHVGHIADFTASDWNVIPPEGPELIESARLAAEDELDEMLNFLPLTGISARTEVALGAPIEKLVGRTKKADVDMVIMSSHGYTGLRRVVQSSIAEQLVRRANCPVLVVPSHRRSDSEL